MDKLTREPLTKERELELKLAMLRINYESEIIANKLEFERRIRETNRKMNNMIGYMSIGGLIVSIVNFDLLASALTIVIADTIIKPKIEVNDGSVKIIYEFSGFTITELSTIFELEQCFRLDFFVEKVTLKIKHQIYNSMSERYIVK